MIYLPFDNLFKTLTNLNLVANHSAEHPEGILNQEVLKSFYSITGDKPSDFKWTPGHEKIPDNWYRRNTLDAYVSYYFAVFKCT